jgi:hypothetical protein
VVGARVVALVAAAVLALAACVDDDDDGAEVVTAEQWAEEAELLCSQTGPFLAQAYTETVPDSDAEEAAFYTTELIPRTRGLVNQLALLGFPPENEAEYRAGLNDVIAALAELEAEPYEYIDQRHQGIDPENDVVSRIQRGLAAADVPC